MVLIPPPRPWICPETYLSAEIRKSLKDGRTMNKFVVHI